MSERPLLRVVRGEPDDAELAALAVVLASVPAVTAAGEGRRSGWVDRETATRRLPRPGPGVWRASLR